MDGGAIYFGLFVTLGIILGRENEVSAAPSPDPLPQPGPMRARFDICTYFRRHRHGGAPVTTAAPDTPKPDRVEKIERFGNLLQELLGLEKEAEKNKEEKKKEETKKEGPKKVEPKGFSSMNEFWDKYVEFLTALFYSF